MKKTFVIQVEYPDNDVIPSEEVMEVTQECIEHYMELHFGANIMDGDYDRIKVKEVTDGFTLVKKLREAQMKHEIADMRLKYHQSEGRDIPDDVWNSFACTMDWMINCEDAVDEYLEKIES